ncbi:hypothetical protein BD413DRAFT_465133 [Trametes elegans]|nr:hypothetical protein BD413DRAFT_465133 [Trametes elegans]
MVAPLFAPGAAFASLSSDVAIQFILADIPLFAVGILAFGVLMFFFLMKRVDKWIFSLHLSALAAFLAALFDLSQILIRGSVAMNQNLDAGGVAGLITAREVFYGFANGLRLFFYWGFVASIPLGETIPEGSMIHSASWQRWGILGMLLKWSTLLLVILSTIFQLIYRQIQAFEKIGAIYEAAGTLDIIVSAVFILKLLLNTWARFSVGTNTPSKGQMLVQYAPVIVALLFSFWIAIGNVILFNFTETALGRFLRAVELYILVVYMLTISFHHLRHLSFFPVYRPARKNPSRAGTFDRGSLDKVNNEKTAAISPVTDPVYPAPVRVDLVQALEQQFRLQEMPPTMMRNSSRAPTFGNNSQHQSMAARLSTWMGVARPIPQPPPVVVQPWDVDSERGPSPTQRSIEQPTRVESWPVQEIPRNESPPLPPPPPIIDEDEQRGVSPIPEHPPMREVEERKAPSPVPSSTKDYPATPGIIEPSPEPSPIPEQDWRDIEYSNAVRYSGGPEEVVANALSQPYFQHPNASMLQVSNTLSPSRPSSAETDLAYLASPYPTSPVGSAAVTPTSRIRPLPPMPRPNSALFSPSSPLPPDSARSSNNMSILLRRQTELDESIAALRLFSPSKAAFDLGTMPVQTSEFYTQLAQPSPLPSDGGRLSMVASMESPELSAPSPDLTLATPHSNRMPHSSAVSEFSLSNFQHQPPLNRGSVDSGVIPQMGIAVEEPSEAGDAMSLAQREAPEETVESPVSVLEPPRMLAAMGSRFSDSSSVAADGREKRFDSLGTQYEITSFIGNLTIPGSQKDSTISASSAGSSDEGSVNVAVAKKTDLSIARPTLIAPSSSQEEVEPQTSAVQPEPSSAPADAPAPIHVRTPSDGRRPLPPIPKPAGQLPVQLQPQPQQPRPPPPVQPLFTQSAGSPPRFRRAVGLPPRPRLSVVKTSPVEERMETTTALVSSPQSGSGTPSPSKR